MENELINGKTIQEIDDLIDEYRFQFGEEPIVEYPQTIYSPKYVTLIQRALELGKPYTEDDLYTNGEETDI